MSLVIVRNQLSGAGAGCKCNGCMIARAYVALQAQYTEVLRQITQQLDNAGSGRVAAVRALVRAAQASRLAKLEQERDDG